MTAGVVMGVQYFLRHQPQRRSRRRGLAGRVSGPLHSPGACIPFPILVYAAVNANPKYRPYIKPFVHGRPGDPTVSVTPVGWSFTVLLGPQVLGSQEIRNFQV